MKTKPIGVRFEQEEYDLICAYADSEGETFSDVVRKGVMSFIDSDRRHGYRPLSQLAETEGDGDLNLAFGQFLDDFSRARDKHSLIVDEPIWHSDPGRWRYDFAATAHKLAHENNLPVPQWVLKEEYIAPKPAYAFNTTNPEFQQYLRETTPREFQWHNLFLGENILFRA